MMTARILPFVESSRGLFVIEVFAEQPRSLHPKDADHKGFGRSPTSILNLDLKNLIQKLQVGTSLHCLPLEI